MNNSLVNAAFRAAQWTIILSFTATALLVAALIGERIVFERTSRDAAEASKNAALVAARIMLADERLTMSANMAAATGQRHWVDRYDSFIPNMEEAITAATRMSTERAAEEFDQATRVANDNLMEMERRSFAAVAENDLPMARSILNSQFYAFQKRSLADGTDRLLQTLADERDHHAQSVQSTAKVILSILIAAGAAGFGFLWWLMRQKLRVSRDYYRRIEQRLAFMAQHDELTGLANRRALNERMERDFFPKQRFKLLLIDLDRFKPVNDTYGHAVGDRLLIQVAERLTGIAGPEGFVARLGGDELALLVYGDLEEAKAVAARVIDAIARPFRIDGLVVSVGCSIGMCCTDETRDTTELMQFSDLALYEAKRHGRGRWICYTRGMLDAVTERVRLGADMAASRA